MSIYMNQRRNKRASDEAIKYMLGKHRDNLMKQDNNRRRKLKETLGD